MATEYRRKRNIFSASTYTPLIAITFSLNDVHPTQKTYSILGQVFKLSENQ